MATDSHEADTDGPPEEDWREIDSPEGAQIDEYDLTTSPNDFNISTIYSFIQSGSVRVPGFQRNYVWDIKRASRLIESLIIGLPVPQVFLYEEDRNRFLVVDGQQRLMTIYYFMSGRFPRKERRSEIRTIFDENGEIPMNVLNDDEYFQPFVLQLSEIKPGVKNKFAKLSYTTLADYKMQFDMRTIRNMIVKQIRPSDDTSSIYEMFNRLNTGGVNLTPQEIRSSLFHSQFSDELYKWNMEPRWRTLLGQESSDLHMRDIEILLRALAMASGIDTYASSMVKFLNTFAKDAQKADSAKIAEYHRQFEWFLDQVATVDRSVWLVGRQKFGVNLFETVFAASVRAHQNGTPVNLTSQSISAIKDNPTYIKHAKERTTAKENVYGRFGVAVGELTS